MIKGKTPTAFNFEIEEDVVDDYELLELIADVEEHPEKVVKLIPKVLGEKQKDKLIEHVKKTNNGKCSVTSMMREMSAIFEGATTLKK